MKKIVSLLLTAILLATMLTVFAVPAFADEEPIECDTTRPNIEITSAGNYIIKQDCTLRRLMVSNKDSTLTIPEGVTVTVTEKANISSGAVKLNGTLDVSGCPDKKGSPGFSGENNINIGETGTLIKNDIYAPGRAQVEGLRATIFSEGNIWIIVAVAVVAVAGVAALVIVKKKKKPAVASSENTDEE